jgi:hypothetical protein
LSMYSTFEMNKAKMDIILKSRSGQNLLWKLNL